MKTKLWLDGEKSFEGFVPDPENWTWAKNYHDALFYLSLGNVTYLSMVGDIKGQRVDGELVGLAVAKSVVKQAEYKDCMVPPFEWEIREADPFEACRIKEALQDAQTLWGKNQLFYKLPPQEEAAISSAL